MEGNTTFYALPDADVVMRWRDATPAGFKFCLKLPQIISHGKQLRACRAETEAFVARLRLLDDRCGPALLQLPPSFGAKQLDRLREWLEAWPSDLRLAVEPRHADFFGAHEAELDALLGQHHVARCTFDTAPLFSADPSQPEVAAAQARKPRWPARHTRTAGFAFIRYVGHPDIQANQGWLTSWAARVNEWLASGDHVFFFVHHPDDTFAPDLAHHFLNLLDSPAAQARIDAHRPTTQQSLFESASANTPPLLGAFTSESDP